MNGFKQLIKKPTRITENTSTIIDVLLTNSPENVVRTDVITTNFSDHEMIGAIRKKCQHKYQPKTIHSRNFRNYNKENVKIEIGNINFDPLFAYANPTDVGNFLKELLVNVANTHVPFTMKTIKGKPCPWLNEDIKRKMNYHDALNRKALKTKMKENWEVYKRQKNRVNNIIKNAKISYHKNLLEENSTKPEQFWKCIKNLFPTKLKNETTCTKFELDGKMISDKLLIANGFCNFFQTVASKLKKSCIPFKEFVWSTPNKKLLNVNSIFKFSHMSVPEVKKHLKQLKRKKAEGIDEIPNCILREIVHMNLHHRLHISSIFL